MAGQLETICSPSYEVTFGMRNSTEQTRINAPIVSCKWERVIDNVSSASVVYQIVGDDCCFDLARVEPWADTMTIKRNGRIVWFGWVRQVEYHRNFVEIRALDALVWLKRLILHDDYAATVDQAYHFENYWNLALSLSPQILGRIEIIPLETGVVDKRSSKFNQIRQGWAAVQEMFDGALDVTAFGTRIYAGLLNFPGVINLTLDDFEGDPTILKDGDQFWNAAWSDASGSIVGHYPNNPAFAGEGIYPLNEAVLRDGMIKDQASANASAKAKVDLSNGQVPRILKAGEDLALRDTAPVDVNQLIPGRIVNLDSTGLCYSVVDSYRLSKVTGDASSGTEKISIGLQPKGGTSTETTDGEEPFGLGEL